MTDWHTYDPPPTVDPLYAALMRGVVARHARDAADAADLVAMLGIERDTTEGGGADRQEGPFFGPESNAERLEGTSEGHRARQGSHTGA